MTVIFKTSRFRYTYFSVCGEMSLDGEEEHFEELLQVLQSIYPELECENHVIRVKIQCKSNIPIPFKLVSSTQNTITEFMSTHFEPISFEATLPINKTNFNLSSSWINLESLRQITEDIQDIISQNPDDEVIYDVLNFVMTDAVSKYENEIYQGYEFITEDFKEFRRLQHMCIQARSNDFNNQRYSCSICLEYKDGGKDGILLDCDHAFCKSCFKEYADQLIDADDVTRLQCPNCPIEPLKHLDTKTSVELKDLLFTRKISSEILEKVLSEESIQKYETLLTSLNFGKYQQYYPYSCGQCPRCSKWLFRDDNDDQLMKCDQCYLNYCFDCRHSWHGTNNPCGKLMDVIPIEILEDMLDGEVSERIKQRYEIKYGRRTLRLAVDSYLADKLFKETVENDDDLISCPSCGTVITKSDGCNKMKCTLCSTAFCYLCGDKLDYKDPYYHYQDMLSDCFGRLFEGMPGAEDQQLQPLAPGFQINLDVRHQ